MKTDENYGATIDYDSNDAWPTTLPPFLNVLTILTFIGSGLGIISGIYSLLTIEQQRAGLAATRTLLRNSSFGGDLVRAQELMLENFYAIQLGALTSALCCLFGAILMRKLKKNGFYLYLFGSIISIVIPLFFLGFGFMGQMILIGSVFTIAFVIMYGVNYKHLK